MIRILAVLLVCLMASAGCNRASDAEVARLKAEAEVAKAEALTAKAELAKTKENADAPNAGASKLKPNQTSSDPAIAQREAAQWILGIGGRIRVSAADKSMDINGIDGKLPDGDFQIVGIQLPGGDKVTNEGIRCLIGLDSIRDLHATTATRLTDFSFLSGLPNLRTFYGSDTDLDDSAAQHLKNASKVEGLYIGSNFQNHVTDDGIQHLKELKFLTHLDILGTRATDVGLGHIKGLTGLKWLAIGNQGLKTDITDAGIAHLAGLSKLEELITVNLAATDAGLERIKNLSNLKRLVLHKTAFTEAGVASLKMALPNCKVEFVP